MKKLILICCVGLMAGCAEMQAVALGPAGIVGYAMGERVKARNQRTMDYLECIKEKGDFHPECRAYCVPGTKPTERYCQVK